MLQNYNLLKHNNNDADFITLLLKFVIFENLIFMKKDEKTCFN